MRWRMRSRRTPPQTDTRPTASGARRGETPMRDGGTRMGPYETRARHGETRRDAGETREDPPATSSASRRVSAGGARLNGTTRLATRVAPLCRACEARREPGQQQPGSRMNSSSQAVARSLLRRRASREHLAEADAFLAVSPPRRPAVPPPAARALAASSSRCVPAAGRAAAARPARETPLTHSDPHSQSVAHGGSPRACLGGHSAGRQRGGEGAVRHTVVRRRPRGPALLAAGSRSQPTPV
jgi:hypothetical protein